MEDHCYSTPSSSTQAEEASSLKKKCLKAAKEHRSRLYVLKRCIIMLLCWQKYEQYWLLKHALCVCPASLYRVDIINYSSDYTILKVTFHFENHNIYWINPEDAIGVEFHLIWLSTLYIKHINFVWEFMERVRNIKENTS